MVKHPERMSRDFRRKLTRKRVARPQGVRKKPGRPDNEDAANLAAQADPVKHHGLVAVEGESCVPLRSSPTGGCQGPKSLLSPTEQADPSDNEEPSTIHQYTMRE